MLGLSFLKTSFPDLEGNSQAFEFLAGYTNLGFLSNLGFVLIGALLTAAVQSSSASMALTLVMSSKGWIPFEIAAAMVLGGNLGTTITAELASLVGNVFGKRTARIHTLFNLIGVIWMVILLPWVLKFPEIFFFPFSRNKGGGKRCEVQLNLIDEFKDAIILQI